MGAAVWLRRFTQLLDDGLHLTFVQGIAGARCQVANYGDGNDAWWRAFLIAMPNRAFSFRANLFIPDCGSARASFTRLLIASLPASYGIVLFEAMRFGKNS